MNFSLRAIKYLLLKLRRLIRAGYRPFIRSVNPRAKISFKPLYRLFLFAAFAVIVVFTINLFAIGKSTFGEWGDFFGGVLNPILTFLTFMGLLITIVIQQTELRESRRELKRSADALSEQVSSTKRQSFESTFFQMLSAHSGILESIDLVDDKGKVTKGRDCFVVFYRRLTKSYKDRLDRNYKGGKGAMALHYGYREFWNMHRLELGHYFRFLYNILRFVKESGYSDGPYIRLIRAQLSDQELLIIFYNCIASEHGSRFKTLAEEFALFDNMPDVRVLSKKHLTMIDKTALGIR